MRADWTYIESFESLPRAHVARLAIEANEIPVQFENAELVSMAWHYCQAVGGIRLLVPRTDVDRARAILNGGNRLAEDVCPACDQSMAAGDPTCSWCNWSFGDADPNPPSTEPGWCEGLLDRLRAWKQLWVGWFDAYPTFAFWLVAFVVGGALIFADLAAHPVESLYVLALAVATFQLVARVRDFVEGRSGESDASLGTSWCVGDAVLVVEPDEEGDWSGTIVEIDDRLVTIRADADWTLYRDIPCEDLRRHPIDVEPDSP